MKLIEPKNCPICNKSFTPLHNKGSEQKYCSPACRQKAGLERLKERIKDELNEQNKGEKEQGIKYPGQSNNSTINGAINSGFPNRNDNYYERNNPQFNQSGNSLFTQPTIKGNNEISFRDYIGIIRELDEAKRESLRYQLKVEQLEREKSELLIQLEELESELNEEENNESPMAMIGQITNAVPGLVEAFKQDPDNTVKFVKSTINSFITPTTK